ncbi:ethanolamine ammonia-lyase subunit EutC [Salipiger mucosus]|uniref:Ethanolamine ammonia-lyase small subunit n=1 Tax=Salipiger mucosus DSM 16094 TaxID=1123237 RepID=S9QXB9_9RHOB|nr:ethanolamine ammonia-lyase subunit EutC [Salipiger mucosus]EPX86011.1 Ethanolamine ammonia-lyase light chain [Salipiger mucosus DSM 16094]
MSAGLQERLAALAAMTPSRVRLDAQARPLPMGHLLSFQEDHAAARDAIFTAPDWGALRTALDCPAPLLRSRARDRASYLRRPDLGRRLSHDSAVARTEPRLAVVIADGLSPPAVMANAARLMECLRAQCPESREAPVFLAEQARVALGDEIGEAAGAEMVLMLIGERPGLSVSDSLGAYLTWAPRIGTRDSARNCVSNIHAYGGLSHEAAAARIAWLIEQAFALGATGIALKDTSAAQPSVLGEAQS